MTPPVRRGRHSCKLRAERERNLLPESNPLSSQISRSVGRWEKGAANLQPDVEVVQRLLEAAAQALQASELDPKGVDGKIARPPATSNTVAAIEALQSRFTSSVDGLIPPESQTWHALLDAAGELDQPDVSSEPRGLVFYCQTFALEVDHGDFLARYGEIQAKTTVKQGDKVRAGQQIAKVGHLIGIQVPSDMLHFELYDKSASGPLTITDTSRSKKRSDGIPFMRRKDLIDPTARLNQWQEYLPQA